MIKFFKMINGEEIVADVDDSDEWCERLELRRPYRHMVTAKGPMLAPYPVDKIDLRKEAVLFSGEVCKELMEGYCQVTGTVLVPSKAIIRP